MDAVTSGRDTTDGSGASAHPMRVPLTANQQALLWLSTFAPKSAAYHPAWAVRLTGVLPATRVRESLDALARRHPAIAVVLETMDDGTVLQAPGNVPIPFMETDAAGWSDDRISEALWTATREPFDLTSGPPIRLTLFRVSETETVLLLVLHHIATDGRSSAVLVETLGELLEDKGNGPTIAPETQETGFFTYAGSELTRLARSERDWEYWRDSLSPPPPALDVGWADRDRPQLRTYEGFTVPLQLSGDLTDTLRKRAAELMTTPYVLLMTAWQTLLHRICGQDDIVVGTPSFASRNGGFEDSVGYFTNMLPLRSTISADTRFRQAVDRTKTAVVDGLDHAGLPFAIVVERLGGLRDPAMTPVFQAIFVFQQFQRNSGVHRFGNHMTPPGEAGKGIWGGLSAEAMVVPNFGAGQFDLALDLNDRGHAIDGGIKANGQIFDRVTVEGLARAFKAVLEAALDSLDAPIGSLPLVTAEQTEALLRAEYRPAPISNPDGPATLHAAFDAVAGDRSDAVALTGDGRRWTYAALAAAANRLAHHLREAGIGPGMFVGLHADRSPEQIIGLLGILKAGGAYVALDPAYPVDRLDLIGADADLVAVVGPSDGNAPIGKGIPYIPWDGVELEHRPSTPPDETASPTDPAYLIYTSGSTGTPKGVPITHHHVLRLFAATADEFGFDQDDVWTVFHSLAFDFSVWEVWGAFLYGGRLVSVSGDEARDPQALLALLSREKVTVLNQTPSAFYRLAAEECLDRSGVDGELSLRHVIFGGEGLDPRRLADWAGRHGTQEPALTNMYGITETTVHVTLHRLSRDDLTSGTSVIGRPISDLEVLLLDQAGLMVPDGLPGEMHVGGDGVAGGYLNRPELTAERFIPHPRDTGRLLYRSGDLAKRRPDGTLVFLGRSDDQLKLNGFRIEPGEIETAMQAHAPILECAVVVRPDPGDPTTSLLVAFLVPEAGTSLEMSEIRSALGRTLPPHLMPHHLEAMAELPRTPSGKLDRSALPSPSLGRVGASQVEGDDKPRTDEERAVCEAMAEALGLRRLSRHAKYFALGGDSIRSLRVIAGLRRRGYSLALADLFRLQSPTEIAPILTRIMGETPGRRAPYSGLSEDDRRLLAQADAGPLEDAYPATALQTGMLFHGENEAEAGTFRDAFAYRVGAPLNPDALHRAVKDLVAAHPTLRTHFILDRFSEPIQLVSAEIATPFEINVEPWDGSLASVVERMRGMVLPISEGPLVRFQAFPESDRSFCLGIALHHAVLDGWSVASMVTELLERYGAYTKGLSFEFTKPPSFRDFILDHEKPARDDETGHRYWARRLDGVNPTDLPPPEKSAKAQTTEGQSDLQSLQRSLPNELVQSIDRLAEHSGLPASILVLAAYLRVLGPLCGETAPVVGLTRHGRPEIENSDRTLGLFLSIQPFPLDLKGSRSWLDLCRRAFESDQDDQRFRTFPLSEILRASGTRTPFQAAYNPIDYHVYDRLEEPTAPKILAQEAFERTDLPVVLHRVQNTEGLLLHLSFDPEKLSPDLADLLLRGIERALSKMTATPDEEHSTFSLLDAKEAAAIPAEWTGTSVPYPSEASINDVFSVVAAASPDAVALVSQEGTAMTYGELDRASTALAARLRSLGVTDGARVGIILPRSSEQIVASLAALKAGGVYVPIEPSLPRARRDFILEDAGVVAVVAPDHQPLPDGLGRIAVDLPFLMEAEETPLTPVLRSGEDPAYVIYTSGSTGRPKGVECTHRGVVRLVKSGPPLRFEPQDRLIHAGAVVFDICMVEIWGALLTGARAVVLPAGRPDPETLASLVAKNCATVLSLATSLFHLLVDAWPQALSQPQLRMIIVGGEAMSADHAGRALKMMPPHSVLLNGYGPTENAVFTTMHSVAMRDAESGEIPIGLPIPNSTVDLVDGFGNPVPSGVRGELIARGDGVAQGYLNLPELNASAFGSATVERCGSQITGRFYRTGDIVIRRRDGALMFQGRRDRQIKLRGFRIELGEITHTLRRHDDVADAVVVVDRAGPAPRLVAYVVGRDGVRDDWPSLRDDLSDTLPDYMVPEIGVFLSALPLGPTGKVDQQALPKPASSTSVSRAAATETEEVVQRIWRQVLGHRDFGVDDDFFAVGGDSLFATQIASRLTREFGVEIPITTVMASRTVAALAQEVDTMTLTSAAPDALAEILAELDLADLELPSAAGGSDGKEPGL